jgi:membrane protein YqaA with SNARE-associated domain
MDYISLGYIGLFVACFLSATIIPFFSEGVFLVFVLSGFDPYVSLVVATSGNTLGGATNYALGLIGKEEKIRKMMKRPERFDRLSDWVKKYGVWLALLSWTPIIGDPLTIVLGFFRVKFIPMFILMTIGKLIRYSVILYFAL